MNESKILFIGAGNMASALIEGLINDGFPAKHIIASDLDESKLLDLSDRLSIQTNTDSLKAMQQADCVVLAVKPQVLKLVCESLSDLAQQQKPLFVSIAAGITSASIEQWLGGNIPVVRTMPNTPAMLQTGATGLFANSQVSDQQRTLAESLMNAVGITLWVNDEDLINAVTAVSGSGPAYFFLVIEAMTNAGVALGLDESTAKQLTLQTALGAARMAIEGEDDAATLRKKVTSPGGTTEQAINHFEQQGLRDTFSDALDAAYQRAITLSSELAKD